MRIVKSQWDLVIVVAARKMEKAEGSYLGNRSGKCVLHWRTKNWIGNESFEARALAYTLLEYSERKRKGAREFHVVVHKVTVTRSAPLLLMLILWFLFGNLARVEMISIEQLPVSCGTAKPLGSSKRVLGRFQPITKHLLNFFIKLKFRIE